MRFESRGTGTTRAQARIGRDCKVAGKRHSSAMTENSHDSNSEVGMAIVELHPRLLLLCRKLRFNVDTRAKTFKSKQHVLPLTGNSAEA